MEKPTVRHVTDSRVLAALAHPLRRRLMDVLKVYGPCPVGLLAERTGQAPANVSHHLKVLAAADLVLEAPELARDRRERWWRLRDRAIRWSTADFDGDPAAYAAHVAGHSAGSGHHHDDRAAPTGHVIGAAPLDPGPRGVAP